MTIETVTIVTVCRNAADLLPATIASVVGQRAFVDGRARLQYLIRDGASTDDTASVLAHLGDESIDVVSAPDSGMYDALATGFRAAEGELVAYLNAGDYLFPWAVDVAIDVMEQTGSTWLTGYATTMNAAGQVTSVKQPPEYSRSLISAGAYGRGGLPFIHQESTMWRRDLLAEVDLAALAEYRLAGDHYLWHCFAQRADLDAVDSLIGAFLVHHGQLSSDRDGYWREVERHAQARTASTRLRSVGESLAWRLPPPLTNRLAGARRISYDEGTQRWRRGR